MIYFMGYKKEKHQTLDIESVREVNILLFDVIPVKPIGGKLEGLGICNHPYTNSSFTMNPQTGELLDLTNKEDYGRYRNKVTELINVGNLPTLYTLVRSPYKLLWFKMCHKFLDEENYGNYLINSWRDEDNPNQDIYVSQKQAVAFFRAAKKEFLMSQSELKYYNSLTDQVTVYRGVSPGRAYHGLSWTDDKDKAIWFKQRFEDVGKAGKLLSATIHKKDVLAYTDGRGEKELIVDMSRIKDVREVS